ncbi:molecular chaperone DnaJ [Dactylosporangium cerinum]
MNVDGSSAITLPGGDRAPLCFTVDGRLLAATTEGSAVVIWDVEEQRRLDVVPVSGPVSVLAVTDRGDIAAVADGQVVLLAHRSPGDDPQPGPDDVEQPPEPAADQTRPFQDFQRIMDGFLGGSLGEGPRPRVRPGADAILRLELDLQESAFGVEAPIEFDTAVVCAACAGAGTAPDTHPDDCPACAGRGEVRMSEGAGVAPRTCAYCQGQGILIPNPCVTCEGDGRVSTRRALTVKIPAGVEDGMRIRLAQQGEVGPGGGPPGDLYVEIHERPHNVFTRKNDDLHCRVTVPMAAAALGTQPTIQTLDGEVTFDVHPGEQSGATVRIAGKGVPHLHRSGRGDLIAHLGIPTPKFLTAYERLTLMEFATHRAENAAVAPSSYTEHDLDVHVVVSVPMALAALGTSFVRQEPRQW